MQGGNAVGGAEGLPANVGAAPGADRQAAAGGGAGRPRPSRSTGRLGGLRDRELERYRLEQQGQEPQCVPNPLDAYQQSMQLLIVVLL